MADRSEETGDVDRESCKWPRFLPVVLRPWVLLVPDPATVSRSGVPVMPQLPTLSGYNRLASN